MKRNFSAFFAGMVVGVAALFILVFAAPSGANAYAIGGSSAASGTTPSGGYDFSGSLQNLLAPFSGFIDSLKGNTTIVTNGASGYMPLPNLDAWPEIENTIMGWLTEFDNWFYGISGVHLSGIMYVLLNAIAWALGLAQSVVNWLLGLFH